MNGFSKRLENQKSTVVLYVAHYNICHVHETIRVTPALEKATQTPVPPPLAPQSFLLRNPKKELLEGRTPFQLRVMREGKISN
jgi:hypothetical protein